MLSIFVMLSLNVSNIATKQPSSKKLTQSNQNGHWDKVLNLSEVIREIKMSNVKMTFLLSFNKHCSRPSSLTLIMVLSY